MELKNQVCSLELAKRLKELGVKQESLFCYYDYTGKGDFRLDLEEHHEDLSIKNGHDWKTIKNKRGISAFTVAELGEMLPKILEMDNKIYKLFVRGTLEKQWFIVYANERDFNDWGRIQKMVCHNEAETRAKTLIYLLENKKIKMEE